VILREYGYTDANLYANPKYSPPATTKSLRRMAALVRITENVYYQVD
jgi:hypothetical protein